MAQTLGRVRWAVLGAVGTMALGLGGAGTISVVEAIAGDGERSVFVPLTPMRILDTRLGTGGVSGPIVHGGAFEVQVAGVGGVPADATGVVLNVTSTQTTAAGYVTIWPANEARPDTSNLNITAGQDLPNLVTVKLGAGGRLGFYNFGGELHLIADVAGYYVDHHHDDRYYSKQQVDELLAGYLTSADAEQFYVQHADLTNRGVVRWGVIRDLGSVVEVYQDNEQTGFDPLSVVRTGTGVYEVTVPGVAASGAFHAVFVTAQQGQVSVFRACKVFQTVSAGDPAGTLVVRVRCYDATPALQDSDFSILVLH